MRTRCYVTVERRVCRLRECDVPTPQCALHRRTWSTVENSLRLRRRDARRLVRVSNVPFEFKFDAGVLTSPSRPKSFCVRAAVRAFMPTPTPCHERLVVTADNCQVIFSRYDRCDSFSFVIFFFLSSCSFIWQIRFFFQRDVIFKSCIIL